MPAMRITTNATTELTASMSKYCTSSLQQKLQTWQW